MESFALSALESYASFQRFRPYLTLEASPLAVPIPLQSILPTWNEVQTPTESFMVYEQALTARFRQSLVAVERLEPFAVPYAGGLRESLRSRQWLRLLEFQKRYPALDLRRKMVLLKLLSTLGFYRDNERLLATDAPIRGGTWDELYSNYAYLRVLNPYKLYELQIGRAPVSLLEVAERTTPATRVRLIAFLKYLVIGWGNGVAHGMDRAGTAASRTLEDLRSRLPRAHAVLMESKYWRALSFQSYFLKDFPETLRRLDLAEVAAREAVDTIDTAAAGYAREELYSVLKNRIITEMKLGNETAARPRIDAMISLEPAGGWQRVELGKLLLRTGELERARQTLELGFELSASGRGEACLSLARCCALLGDRPAAAAWLDTAGQARLWWQSEIIELQKLRRNPAPAAPTLAVGCSTGKETDPARRGNPSRPSRAAPAARG